MIKDKEERNKYLKIWRDANKDKCTASRNKYLEKNPEKKLLKASRGNAKARGLEHTITLQDIKIPDVCPYLGIKLTSEINGKNNASTLSLDRIDNTKGYVPGNIQVISRLANNMKSNATLEQMAIFAEAVLKMHSKT